MIKRIIEISNPARLTTRNQQMVIEREGLEEVTVPIEDLGVLILDHPAISHSQGLLTSCFENNVAVLVCGKKHLPSGLFLPLEGNSLHSKVISHQAVVPLPTRKRLWKEIVQAKIKEQTKLLTKIRGKAGALSVLSERVKSGDPENIESQAARIYWQKLFGSSFRRNPLQSGINTLLNYGYSILRAAFARAIVGTGLHPSLGLHHHNQYNNFCLADDLMEPLRPEVDSRVYTLSTNQCIEPDITPENKKTLLEIFEKRISFNNQEVPLIIGLQYYAASVRKVICGESDQM